MDSRRESRHVSWLASRAFDIANDLWLGVWEFFGGWRMNKLLELVMGSKLLVLFGFICELVGDLGRDRPVMRNCPNTRWVLEVGGMHRGWSLKIRA